MTSLLEAMGFGDMFLHVKKSLYSSSTATLLINGLRSGNVLLQRGTWQGCPFSPLLFAICMEPLAHRIRCHPEIQGLRTQTMEHKVSLFADDMMAYVSYPSTSLKYLQEELDQFGELSGLRVNVAKSELFPIYISPSDKQALNTMFPYRWVTSTWRYLGVHIPVDLSKLLHANFDPIVEDIQSKLKHWHKNFLSWPDRIHLIKSFVFPKFLFLFRTLVIPLPDSVLRKWQKMLLDFLWAYKRHRIATSKLTRPTVLGGLNIPNLSLYYEVAQLVHTIKLLGAEDNQTEGWMDMESQCVHPMVLQIAVWRSTKDNSIL